MEATKSFTYITSKLCQFENTYGELSLYTDGERLYLRTNAGKKSTQAVLPIEAKSDLTGIISSLRPANYMSHDEESLKHLMEIQNKYEAEVEKYVSDEDKDLIKMMLFSPIAYNAELERNPRIVEYLLWYRDGAEADSNIVVLEEGTADEVYVNRKALKLKNSINRPLMISILNEQSGEMEPMFQISACRFFPLDKNGNPLKGQYLNADGMTFTKDADTKYRPKPESMYDAYKEQVRRRIAKVVKLKRIELDMTQAQLAEKAGITKQTVCNIESGDYNVSIDVLSAVMAVLGINLNIE